MISSSRIRPSFGWLLIGLAWTSALHAQNTATLNATGNWTNPAIWTTVPAGNFPNNDNPAPGDTWNVTINANTPTVNAAITINNLNWAAGTITGAHSLELQGTASTFSGAGTKDIGLLAADLRNAGTIILSGTNLRANAVGSGLTNLSGALFNITSDGNALTNFNTGTFHNNAGATFRKSAGAGTSTLAWTFNNHGTVEVQTGTLQFNRGGIHSGSFTASAGANFRFSGGTHSFQTGSTLVAPGAFTIDGATLNLGAATAYAINGTSFTISSGNLNLGNATTLDIAQDVSHTSGSLGGFGDASSVLNLNGNYAWAAGSVGGNGVVNFNGTNNVFSSGGFKNLAGTAANVRNAGTITLSGTNVRALDVGGGLTNLSGALFDITGDGNALTNFNTGTFHNNAGATFRKSAGVGTSTVAWNFNNHGTLEVQTGTLQFTGTYGQSATGSLLVNNATVQLPGSPSLQGALGGTGTIQATGITHANGVIAPGLSAGTLAFTGDLTLSADTVLDFELGTVSDLITVGGNLTVNGILNLYELPGLTSGAYTLFQYGGTFTNAGLTLGNTPSGSYVLFHDAPNSRLQVIVTTVPEPTTLALCGLGLAGVAWSSRRRKPHRALKLRS